MYMSSDLISLGKNQVVRRYYLKYFITLPFKLEHEGHKYPICKLYI